MLFNNKKAISPLVATILLIAFAVSIGALIMNWSSSEEVIPIVETNSCDALNLKILTLCQSNEELSIKLHNSGIINIEKIILRSEANGINFDYFVPSSKIITGKEASFTVQKSVFNATNNIKVIPVIISSSDELLCKTKMINQLQLPTC